MKLIDFFNKFNDYPEALTILSREQGRYIESQIAENDGDVMDELVRQYQDRTVIDYDIGFNPNYIWVEVVDKEEKE